MAWSPTVPEDDVPHGSCFEAHVGDERILLIRSAGKVFACASRCPHKAMDLVDGAVEDGKLTCPLHAATFDLGSGKPDEDTDWAGQLETYETKVKDGIVHVNLN